MTLSELRKEFFEKFACSPSCCDSNNWMKDDSVEEVWAWFEKELIKKNGSHSLAVYINDLEDKNQELEKELSDYKEIATSYGSQMNKHSKLYADDRVHLLNKIKALEAKNKKLLNALHAIKSLQEMLGSEAEWNQSSTWNIAKKALE